MPEATHVVQAFPGGVKVLHGGSRRGVKLSRPVEAGVLFDSAKTKCPFHRPDEKSLAEYFEGEIRVMANPMTPHHNHRIVIPRECTDEPFVRSLGGRAFIVQCLKVIGELAVGEEFSCGVHAFRGQNIPHLHWHLSGHHPEEQPDFKRESWWTQAELDERLIVLHSRDFQVVVRGPRVGQLMLIPRGRALRPLAPNAAEVGGLLSELVELTNRAFTSSQGEMPRYTVSGRISAGGGLRFLLYSPELQPLGYPADIADISGTALVAAWSWLETAEHLKKVLAG